MSSLNALTTRIRKLEDLRAEQSAEFDPATYAWYATSCPCGLPAGECTTHPRARSNQRPPKGEWRTHFVMAGRGFGKTRVATEYVRYRIEKGLSRRVALVGATAADVRDTIVEGPSGLIEIAPPNFRPRYEPSKRRLTWPNGAKAFCYSAEEPDRLRGPQHDLALCDEVAAWKRPEAWDMLMLGLRLGSDPRAVVASTPKHTQLIKSLVQRKGTVVTRGRTQDNARHLAEQFIEQIIATYDGTRLGRQEVEGELLEFSEAAWFITFDESRHVSESAQWDPRRPVLLAIDAGVSRHTAAVWMQAEDMDKFRHRITVFGEYYAEGSYSAENAAAIRATQIREFYGGMSDMVRLDPAASARSGTGPAAFNEYERVFGASKTSYWPQHRVLDGLEHIEILLGCQGKPADLVIHPRCKRLIEAFKGYERASVGGQYINAPKDPQHPHEDLMDALRGGLRSLYPEGRVIKNQFARVRVEDFF